MLWLWDYGATPNVVKNEELECFKTEKKLNVYKFENSHMLMAQDIYYYHVSLR